MEEIRSAWADHPGYAIDLVPCRGTARVRVGDTVLAESTRAIRVIETDHVERLYFPESDVRTELLETNDHHTVCPFKGRASYWSSAKSEPPVEDLFWTYPDPFPEVAGIAGHLGVYHEKAVVEIETAWPDGPTSVNRFPAWGDLSDLVDLLDPEAAGPGMFAGRTYHVRDRNVVEGGQLVGQAVLAASRTVANQRVTWASATFVRPAGFDRPTRLVVQERRLGRTFSTLSVDIEQDGKLVSPVTVLMDSGADDTLRAVDPMPEVDPPGLCVPLDMGVVGRYMSVVDGAYGDDRDATGPPEIHVWLRMRDNPSEPAMRQALVAQSTTHWAIAAAMRPHAGVSQSEAHVSLSTGPVALAIAFHDDAPLDEWLLYSTRATWSGRGLVQGDGRVWTAGGVLVATFVQQAMVRRMLDGGAGRDASNAM